MIKTILLLLALGLGLSADEIKWEKEINAAIAKAEKEHKPLMVLVTKKSCRWCDVLKKEALSNPKVIAMVNRDYVAYEGVVEEGGVPNSLMTPGTPATWFIKGRTPMFEPVMGAVKTSDFIMALEVVKKEYEKKEIK